MCVCERSFCFNSSFSAVWRGIRNISLAKEGAAHNKLQRRVWRGTVFRVDAALRFIKFAWKRHAFAVQATTAPRTQSAFNIITILLGVSLKMKCILNNSRLFNGIAHSVLFTINNFQKVRMQWRNKLENAHTNELCCLTRHLVSLLHTLATNEIRILLFKCSAKRFNKTIGYTPNNCQPAKN